MRPIKGLAVSALLGVTGFVLVGFVWVSPAEAVPAFARRYEKQCSYCHVAFPQLNRRGRTFKELGYKLEEEEGTFDLLGEAFPISAMFVSRPFDKSRNGNERIRAFHELEVFLSGQIAQKWSGWVELEWEDDAGDGFETEFGNGVLGYHLNRAINVQFAYAPFFWADPYGFLGGHFRMRRDRPRFINTGFGGADAGGRLRDNRQQISVYGRPIDQLLYIVGFSGAEGDVVGAEPRNFHGRLAFEPYTRTGAEGIPIDTMIGVFGVAGNCDKNAATCGTPDDRPFHRIGVDGQLDVGDARIQAAWVTANDDISGAGGGDVDNDAFSAQAFYVIKKGKRPWIVPLVAFDWWEQNDGDLDHTEMVLNLTYYLEENVKAHLNWFQELGHEGRDESYRFVAQIFVGF